MTIEFKQSKPILKLASFDDALDNMIANGPTSILGVVKEPAGAFMVRVRCACARRCSRCRITTESRQHLIGYLEVFYGIPS